MQSKRKPVKHVMINKTYSRTIDKELRHLHLELKYDGNIQQVLVDYILAEEQVVEVFNFNVSDRFQLAIKPLENFSDEASKT